MENQRTQQQRPGSAKPGQPQRKPANQPGTQQPKDKERQKDRREYTDNE